MKLKISNAIKVKCLITLHSFVEMSITPLLECILNAKVCESKANLLQVFLKLEIAFKFSENLHREQSILTLKQSLQLKRDIQREVRVSESKLTPKAYIL